MTARVRFRGGWTCSCVAKVLPYVEDDMLARGLIQSSIDVYQFGWRNDVEASAGTHSAGGCFDVGQYSPEQIAVWRRWGVTMQHRTTAQGFDGDHGHGWPRGCPHLSQGARFQASEWEARRNGLRGRGRVAGAWPILGFDAAIRRNPTPLVPADLKRIADRTAALVLAQVGREVWHTNVAPKGALVLSASASLATLGALARPKP